ncbi:hypothetical protein MRX96_018104 [Rhipicephalus microplus]
MDDDVAVALSGTVAEERGLLQRVLSIEQTKLYGTSKLYEDVFEGLGELQGIVYHFRFRLGFRGVVKPARWISIALKIKTKAVLDCMKTAGVIEKEPS